MNTTLNPPTFSKALRLPEVCNVTGLSATTVLRLPNDDPTFPKPFHPTPRTTTWDEQEIRDWLDSKKMERVK